MHLLVTDRLACPRCGPEFGLILLADRISDRHVSQGSLGCPNCRDKFPIEDGRADLRPPPRGDVPAGSGREGGELPEPIRIAALLGIPGGPGSVLLLGGCGRVAPALAALIDGVNWIDGDATSGEPDARAGVTKILVRGRLPFFSRGLRGVAFGHDPHSLAPEGGLPVGPVSLDEAARVVAPMGRVVILSGGPDSGARLVEAGLELVLEQDGVVVAARKS